MIIQRKRVRNIARYTHFITDEKEICIGIEEPSRFLSTMEKIGFSNDFKEGDSLLPKIVGKTTSYNSEGSYLIHKNKEKETVYHSALWHWKQWDGPYNTIDRSKIIDRPYQRYPRTFIAPPGIELSIVKNNNGKILLISPLIKKNVGNEDLIKHVVNIFLELFGECQFFTENLEGLYKTPIRRLNWTIFPQGEMPWGERLKILSPIVESAPKGNRVVLYDRLKTINDYKPDFMAVGRGGFHGYIVHGFTNKKIYVLESMYYGNATYIFNETWEELTKKTKAEILNEDLQKDRIIHISGWKGRINNIINVN